MNPNALSPQTPAGAPMERRDFIVSTYKHLGVAMLAFVVLSAVLMVSGLSTAAAKMLMASGSKFLWLGVMGAFMLVGWLASHLADNTDNPQTQLMGLGLYVLAEGLIFAPMFGIAQLLVPGAIGAAAFITLLLVAALTWTAFSSKTDFSFLGGILKVAGLVALGTIIAGAIFGFKLGIWFSGLMVLFAGACVLYDTSRIIHDYPADRPAGAALHLFASIALMLWYVLRILISLAMNDD
ncbi:FtsH-binding integral membrane protein [Acidovorax delafieldii]|uniref:Bax inhibitor-1/YccA family protein n=1 Tax=Acidovorax delafieldii TaxID=47920 RepID=UPI0028638DE2|nr:Bax inhibitor-1 family protein [Acidovorax delafieldii]MDR6155966.1 FtsH-binding integral membrane protein [Acidovorax delafieldii]